MVSICSYCVWLSTTTMLISYNGLFISGYVTVEPSKPRRIYDAVISLLPCLTTPYQVIRTIPISHQQLAPQNLLHRCVPLVDAVTWICLMLWFLVHSWFYCPKVECYAFLWNQSVIYAEIPPLPLCFILCTIFRNSTITLASALIRSSNTVMDSLVLSLQCGKATAVFVPSRHRGFVAEFRKFGSRSLDCSFSYCVQQYVYCSSRLSMSSTRTYEYFSQNLCQVQVRWFFFSGSTTLKHSQYERSAVCPPLLICWGLSQADCGVGNMNP